ncbi:4a-hydroxytetrahydrobiopterin dehydratase [Microbacterium allomyrinae]|uniref:Putative pterin-4-alpha-carbinolamine dehydratase n=1 Tax=Microbacterium allomyrinae TaxID=2830666 RepID=A0A9X1S2J6_9MICO|nr:4a-hydroxytetrahydrobiopterin dehydratase [Microbacterium allomyrinae]MCC2031185.1 4a-hydroxytetrahydrobiopterin dehydratase [Microbacterium allomyrinae]
MDTITTKEFRAFPGVEDWRPRATGALAVFRTGSFATGAQLFGAIAELADAAGHHPDVDVRYATVRVRLVTHSAGGLTAKDAAMASRISEAARELDIPAETERMQELMLAISTPDPDTLLPFWKAVTGFDEVAEGTLLDADGRGPLIWFQPVDRPLRGKSHLDVNAPRDVIEQRLEAALAAGGMIADDSHAPKWWTLADADGHKVDLCPWRGPA